MYVIYCNILISFCYFFNVKEKELNKPSLSETNRDYVRNSCYIDTHDCTYRYIINIYYH